MAIDNRGGIFIAGNNSGNNTVNNYEPAARDLNGPWGENLKAQILRDVPRDKPIEVQTPIGDHEATQLAKQIFDFLVASNFEMTKGGLAMCVFSEPRRGLALENAPNKPFMRFVVGARTP